MTLRPFILLALSAFLLSTSQPKKLNVAIDGLKKVKLILRDELMGTLIESYELDAAKYPAFVNDLNGATHNPKLRMTVSCYDFLLVYESGKRRKLSTNGRGIGPTPHGSFMLAENVIPKYWDITKEQLCKPKDPANKKDDIGF